MAIHEECDGEPAVRLSSLEWMPIMSEETRAWLDAQVAQFVAHKPAYDSLAGVMRLFLRRGAESISSEAIIQVRTKSVASFAEKCLRKRDRRPDPVHQFTDLCAARVVTRSRAEVQEFCNLVTSSFLVDWENSVDASSRLRPQEFGYRSVHYIVALRPDIDYGCEIPADTAGLRAEIQVRTFAEHAYSDFEHNIAYKGAFHLPVEQQRDLAVAAANLEEADGIFARIEQTLHEYASHYGTYLTLDQIGQETELLRAVLQHEPLNVQVAQRLARLGMTLGDWDLVVRTLEPIIDSGSLIPVGVERDLGAALCQLHSEDRSCDEYARGQRLLQGAAAKNDVDALCLLADTQRGIDDDAVLRGYRRAYEVDASDPRVLDRFIELQLDADPNLPLALAPAIRKGIARCRRQAEASVNLPGSLFDVARFHLLLNEPYEALRATCEGVALSQAAWMVEEARAWVESLARGCRCQPGSDWVRTILDLTLAVRFRDAEALQRIAAAASPGAHLLTGPVVIVAGSADTRMQGEMERFRGLLTAALADAAGTVVSGGTRQGIPGIVGDIRAEGGLPARLLAYAPQTLPQDATLHPGYDELRHTSGGAFSPAEPLQSWVDLIAGGQDASAVRVLGVGGGPIAAFEYQLGLALGAAVGLVTDSRGEAGRLLGDEAWRGRGLICLPADPETLRAFVSTPSGSLTSQERERLGRSVHELYRKERLRARSFEDFAMAEWDDIPEDLKASNRAQADSIEAKAARVGCVIVGAGAAGEPVQLSEDEEEILAEAEHGRWVAERLLAGWRWGAVRDSQAKTSPSLIRWADLPDDTRDRDRQAVRNIPSLLAEAGLGLRRRG